MSFLFGPKIPSPQKVADAQAGANATASEQFNASRPDLFQPGLAQLTSFGEEDPVTHLRRPIVTNQLDPTNQALFEQQQNTRGGIGAGIGGLVGNAAGILSQPFNMTQAGFDAALGGAGLINQMNAPFWQRQTEELNAALRNQGLVPGTPGYDRAQTKQRQDQFLNFQAAVLPWQNQAANQALSSYNTIPSTISTLLGLGDPFFPANIGQQPQFTPQAPNMANIFSTNFKQQQDRADAIGQFIGQAAGAFMGLPAGSSTLGGSVGAGLSGLFGNSTPKSGFA